jgi:hypothetical protein
MFSAKRLRKGLVLLCQGRLRMVLNLFTGQFGRQRPTIRPEVRDLQGCGTDMRTLDQIGKEH